jgi:hypothetical protein
MSEHYDQEGHLAHRYSQQNFQQQGQEFQQFEPLPQEFQPQQQQQYSQRHQSQDFSHLSPQGYTQDQQALAQQPYLQAQTPSPYAQRTPEYSGHETSPSASRGTLSAGLDYLKGLTKKNKDGIEPKRRGPKPDSKPAVTQKQARNRQAQRFVENLQRYS